MQVLLQKTAFIAGKKHFREFKISLAEFDQELPEYYADLIKCKKIGDAIGVNFYFYAELIN